jgi:hypothetical protein
MLVGHSEKSTDLSARCVDCPWSTSASWIGDQPAGATAPEVSLEAHVHGAENDHEVKVTMIVAYMTTLVKVADVLPVVASS